MHSSLCQNMHATKQSAADKKSSQVIKQQMATGKAGNRKQDGSRNWNWKGNRNDTILSGHAVVGSL